MIDNPYNLYNFKAKFAFFLKGEKIAEISRKNYLSDLNCFLGWLGRKNLDKRVIKDYYNFLLYRQTPQKTINRRLSSLRKFSRFCLSQKLIAENPFADFSAAAKKEEGILRQFAVFLQRERRAKATVKNYLADLRQLLYPSVADYQENLKKADKSSPSTIKRKLASLRKFCQWAVRMGYLSADPFAQRPPKKFPAKTLACLFCFSLLVVFSAFIIHQRPSLVKFPTAFLPVRETIIIEKEIPAVSNFPLPSRILPAVTPPATDALYLASQSVPTASCGAYLTILEKLEALTVPPSSPAVLGATQSESLGIHSPVGQALPFNFDFTKNVTVEFDFQTGEASAEVKFNQNQSGDKYYLASWSADGKVSLQKCLPAEAPPSGAKAGSACSTLKSEIIDFEPNSWHHGRITLAFGALTFEIDFKKVRLEAPVAVDLPALQNGAVEFSSNFAALTNLRISPNNSVVLTSGNAKVGDNLILGSDLEVRGNTLLNGRLSIGAADPASKLAVAGLTGASSYNLVRVDTATGNFYYDASSEKYKEDIQPLTDDFSKILTAQPQTFLDKASGQREIGLVAETLAALSLNNLVIYRDGRPEAVKYEKIPLYLLEVIREQQEKLNELAANWPGREEKIISPVVETETIRSGFGDLVIDLSESKDTSDGGPPNRRDSSEVNGFGKLLVKGVNNEVVASLDAEGNATFSGEVQSSKFKVQSGEIEGTLTAGEVYTEGNLTARSATIAGTLYAQKIESEEISAITGKFGELLARMEKIEEVQPASESTAGAVQPSVSEAGLDLNEQENSTSSALLAEMDAFVKELLQAQVASVSADLKIAENISINNEQLASLLASLQSEQSGLTIGNKLNVLGSASLADTTIAGNLLVDGSLSLSANSITSLGPLYLSSTKGIDLLAGKVVISKEGNMTIENNLAVKGSAQFGGDLVASGAGTFNKIFIAAPSEASDSEAKEGQAASSNATAGTATLPAGASELLITNNSITNKSLVYLTPLSSTENRVLYVKSKRAPQHCSNDSNGTMEQCNNQPGLFKVALDEGIDRDIQFNWWIIN